MQIKVVEMKYILLWYIIGKKKSDKRVGKVERMKNRENGGRSFLSFLEMYITGDGKPFYRLSKWLPLIYPLMNINETHK